MQKITRELIEELEMQVHAVLNKREPAVFGIVDMSGRVIHKWHYGLIHVADPKAHVDIHIPERLEKCLDKRYGVITVDGGRGSGKTVTFAEIMAECVTFEGMRSVGLRETLNSIKDSTHQAISDAITRRGLAPKYVKVLYNEIKSIVSVGAIIYRGMKGDTEGLKALAGVKRAWIDEGENVSKASLDTIRPTIFRNYDEDSGDDMPQLWTSFNPKQEDDPSHTELVAPFQSRMRDGIYDCFEDPIWLAAKAADDQVYLGRKMARSLGLPDPHPDYEPQACLPTLVIRCNYNHNPWFNRLMDAERLQMKARDYERYLWIWEGQFYSLSKEQILHGKWVVEGFDIDPEWEICVGADFGTVDPNTLIYSYYDDVKQILYVRHEAYMSGVDLDEIGMLWAGRIGADKDQRLVYDEEYAEKYPGIPNVMDERIWCDESRPDTIRHLAGPRFDFDTRGAPKGPGSVDDGITFLRGLHKIVIHPSCKNTIYEAKNYKWKVCSRTDRILPIPVDLHNHAFDAIRYSLHRQIRSVTGLGG